MSKFAIKEVADVIFFDIETGKPVLFFDTLKVSSIENAAESANATGGKGNANLVTWNYGRTATLQMQDALLSMESLALLSGNDVESTTNVTKRERIKADGAGKGKIKETPVGAISVYKLKDGSMTEEVSGALVSGLEITGLTKGETYAVFYEYKAPVGTKTVRFTSDKFPSTYRVVGDTLVRDHATGKDKVAQFFIPKAQLQAGFTLSMDVENVSTFDFNLDILRNGEETDLYKITVLG